MKKYKLLIFTSTRADFGIYTPLLSELKKQSDLFDVSLLVTGTHLEAEFGNTISEIREKEFGQIYEIPFKSKSYSRHVLTDLMAHSLLDYNTFLNLHKFDLAFVLGDRFEALAFALCCYNLNIRLAHLHGGEVTAGALDDAYRHCITKFSDYHFCATQKSASRIIHLGEHPDRVFNVGALAVDSIKSISLLSRDQLEKELNFKFNKKNICMTFHPETLSADEPSKQIAHLLSALDEYANSLKNNLSVFMTAPNIDPGHAEILKEVQQFVTHRTWIKMFTSLGMIKYLSLVKQCDVVLGNSSSGLLEAPYLGAMTLDIGDRQLGREASKSVFHVSCDKHSILDGLKKIDEISDKKAFFEELYGEGHAAKDIVNQLKKLLPQDKVRKIFYDK